MGSVYERKDSPWLWLKWRDAAGKLQQQKTRFRKDDAAGRAEAEKTLAIIERRVTAERKAAGGQPLTVARYSAQWLDQRRRRGDVSTIDDEATRFRLHINPRIGDLGLADVRRDDVRELVAALVNEGKLAKRSVRNVYGTLQSMFSDALVAGLVTATPCTLKTKKRELPRAQDKDPTWRSKAIFARGEVEQLISDERIPADRRIHYAFLAFTGTRVGESLAAPWERYDTSSEPLGLVHVATSWDSKHQREKGTKKENPRFVPVHLTLARLLAEWRLSGWERAYGRKPQASDLIFPSRRNFRPRHSTKVREQLLRDLATLGLRPRRVHDFRRTFISLLRGAGADEGHVQLITHGPRGDVMSDYTTLPWADLCRTVGLLRIEMRDGRLLQLPRAATAGYGASELPVTTGPNGVPRAGFEGAHGALRGALSSRPNSGHADSPRSASPPDALDRSQAATVDEDEPPSQYERLARKAGFRVLPKGGAR